jgi:hypothetical protein
MDRGAPSAALAVHGSARRHATARRRERAVRRGVSRCSARTAHIPMPPPTDASINVIFGAKRPSETHTGESRLGRERLGLDDAEDAVIEVTKRPVTGDLPLGARESSWSPHLVFPFPVFCLRLTPARPDRPPGQSSAVTVAPVTERLSRRRQWLRPSSPRPGCLTVRVWVSLAAKRPHNAGSRRLRWLRQT